MVKEKYLAYFKNKNITVMGLGLLGRGIGDTIFLALSGAKLTVTDIKKETELAESLDRLKNLKGIDYHLGQHDFSDFEDKDFILKAAGVPLDSPYVLHAKSKDIPIYMSAALLVKIVKEQLKDITVIGITGTRGKSTVTHLISHILNVAGKKVHLGGNVRGMANLPLLDVVDNGDFLVLELDSWQLQGFHDLKISPDASVFTSFLDDHLNYYKGDKESYFNDKAAIFDYMKDDGILIVSPQAYDEISKRRNLKPNTLLNKKYRANNLIGVHNEIAASLAGDLAHRLGVSDEMIKSALLSFNPVEGRLENLGEVNGRVIFNDNNSTTPDATIAAINAITTTYNKKPILIIGGADKGLELDKLKKEIAQNVAEVIYLSGTGTNRLTNDNTRHVFETLSECLDAAYQSSREGDIILFSPGFASFSVHFRNEYERNDEFLRLVREKAYK